MNEAYVLTAIMAVVGGGVVQTLRVVIGLTRKWTIVEEGISKIGEDVEQLKKDTGDRLTWLERNR